MRKTWKTKNLNERPASRAFLALSLAASLAAYGCTTNRTPGNGEPVGVVRPGAGPAAPTSGVTGSSTGNTNPNQAMFSSSTYVEALPSVNARASRLPLSPDQAAAVMADNQLSRGVRVLGPASPGPERGDNGGLTIASTRLPNPAMQINPILTVNSSVNSAAHLPAVAADGGAGVAGGGATGFTAGVTSNSVVSGSPTVTGATAGTGITAAGTAAPTATAAGTGTTGITASSTAVPTPTTAAIPVTPGSFAAGPGIIAGTAATTNTNSGTLTPTVSSAANPTPTVTTSRTAARNNGGATVNGAGTATANGSRTATRTGTLRTARNTTTARTSTAAGTASGNVAPIRVSTDASGKVTITNTASGRQQK